ncbi:CPBP family intramembrane metalloprotease [Flavobacteriaceae bacterium S0825]|uniref:CPBP family intramembrane glutamic endopeptidase n=1 Tax=Gaetbulibacter sp. S0825 TaxID=2720084 RepID=UPI0014311597|nr:CPBP family intramembrane glutamic endopeptidase [Gaetbulibacter sp. S0825]MCK0109591.1 CPBP family intramembrane metalloprotease [Flavobacteriaceae bacterium S0825]NIX65224.1 CPBP family intramembrane metalloprotease [Gaetbulibacter sp. S0825]
MYISQVFKVEHDWWRYIIGVMGAIVGVGVFSMPHLIALMMKVFDGTADQAKFEDMNYLLSLFEPNLNLVFILLPFVGGLICLLLVVKFLHKQSFKMLTTSREKIDWKRFWFAFLFWGIISSGMILMDYFVSPEGYELNFNLGKFLVLCIIAILLVPLQTSFEEYLFRGYLMQGIGALVKNKWVPLLFTSVVFGLLHIANPEIEKLGYILLVYYIGTGLFLGIMTLMDDGLELALGFHAANNLFTALLVTADWTAFQTNSVFKDISDPTEAGFIDVFAPVFILFPILLLIFARVYKWNNWKEKLFGPVVEPPEEDYKVLGEDI